MASRKWAMLVGINRYGYSSTQVPGAAFADLKGAVADAMDMRDLLQSQFGFDAADILSLIDEQATRHNILKAIQNHLAARAGPDDIVVLHFAGHGSSIWHKTTKTREGTLVAHDSRGPGHPDITGAEFRAALAAIRARHVVVALDCCHSGNFVLARGAIQARFIPPSSFETTDPNVSQRGVSIAMSGGPFVLLAAAGPSDPASEQLLDGGGVRGIFTYAFCREARRASRTATYQDVVEATRESMRSLSAQQTPRVEGDLANYVLFANRRIARRPSLSASPTAAGTIRLSGGAIVGVTVGSHYLIYAPGVAVSAEDGAGPIAEVEIIDVNATKSEARLLTGGPILPASRAVEASHRHQAAKVRVYLQNLNGLAEQLSVYQHLEIVDGQPVDLRAAMQNEGVRIDLPAFAISIDVVNEGDAAALLRRTEQRLLHWAKWLNVLRLANPDSPLRVSISVEGAVETESGTSRLTLDANGGFWYSVVNESAAALHVAVLAFGDDGSVAVVLPRRGSRELLPGEVARNRLNAEMSVTRPSERDILKVFAAVSPFDLTVLQMPEARMPSSRAGSNALEEALRVAALGSRPLRAHVPDEWTTAHVVLDVFRSR